MDGVCWIVTRESGRAGSWRQAGTHAPLDRPIVVGRAGALRLGWDPDDDGISRAALTVTATDGGWLIERTNRNGAVLHPWGLASTVLPARTVLDWPLVAVRVTGSDDAHRHWVLLQSRVEQDRAAPVETAEDLVTAHAAAPRPLTAAELHAVWTVFVDVLAWPPRLPAVPLQLKQAARRLGITESAVQQRLEGARTKALALGLPHAEGRLTEPDYVHVLVGAGYLDPPRAEPVADLPTL